MMFRAILVITVALAALQCMLDTADAAPPRYPRVYGPTGGLYGPTQAHYQYQRRYGRPWHGQGGIAYKNYGGSGFYGVPSFGYSSSYSSFLGYGRSGLLLGFGYRRFSPFVGGFYSSPFYGSPFVGSSFCQFPTVFQQPVVNVVTTPVIVQQNPVPVTVRVPQNNAVLAAALEENRNRWGDQLIIDQGIKLKKKAPKPSTPEAKLKSVRAEGKAKEALLEQEHTDAYFKYREAVKHAPDRADPQFGLGFTMVAMKRYTSAVRYFKRGLELDSEWAQTSGTLSDIYGEKNRLAKNAYLEKVSGWVKQDIRDPDRLFLMGFLLYMDNNLEQSTPFFEAALRLAGKGDHLLAFVDLQEEPKKAKPAKAKAAPIQLPAPEPNKPE